ncbi:MAG TPA: TlpA disulfide reductase family protein, partial [Pedobacter sp.]
IKKDAYWHIRLENNSEWLVRGDTLFKKDQPNGQSVTFATDWERHKLGAFNIHNLLGVERPVVKDNIASMEFMAGMSNNEIYVINVVHKIDSGSHKSQGRLKYSRYFIDKKRLLPLRRLQYGKRIEEGKEAVDIYDFSAVIVPYENDFDIDGFFNTPKLQEKARFEVLDLGSKAPNFSARNVRTDQVLSLDSFKGKVVVLDFWYLSCMPCRTLMPILERVQKKFGKERLAVIGINVKDANSKEIVRFLEELHISYSQFYQVGQLLASDYKLQAFPTTLVLDRNGKVRLTELGWGEDTESKLEQIIKKEL